MKNLAIAAVGIGALGGVTAYAYRESSETRQRQTDGAYAHGMKASVGGTVRCT